MDITANHSLGFYRGRMEYNSWEQRWVEMSL